MNKNVYFIVVAVIAISAVVSSVPSCGSTLHASCQLNYTFSNADCQGVLKFLAQQFRNCCVAQDIDPKDRNYKLVSVDNDNLIVKGTHTWSNGYVDDQQFWLSQQGADCGAWACSASESVSYYDYSGNFCELHNLVRGINYKFTETIEKCTFHPDSGKEDSYCASV